MSELKIPCLSMWEPWASLMALGWKKIETRSWKTNYHGPLAIQASKRFGSTERELLSTFPFSECAPPASEIEKTLGHIVCIVELVDCRPTEQLLKTSLSEFEIHFGDYGINRYGWLTSHVQRLKRPIPIIGRQGLFSVWMDDSLLDWSGEPATISGTQEGLW